MSTDTLWPKKSKKSLVQFACASLTWSLCKSSMRIHRQGPRVSVFIHSFVDEYIYICMYTYMYIYISIYIYIYMYIFCITLGGPPWSP